MRWMTRAVNRVRTHLKSTSDTATLGMPSLDKIESCDLDDPAAVALFTTSTVHCPVLQRTCRVATVAYYSTRTAEHLSVTCFSVLDAHGC